MQPIVKSSNELLQGVGVAALPVIYGQVVTYPKSGADLFNYLSDTKESSIPLWPYLTLLFLLLLIADVAVRKLLNVDGSISIQ